METEKSVLPSHDWGGARAACHHRCLQRACWLLLPFPQHLLKPEKVPVKSRLFLAQEKKKSTPFCHIKSGSTVGSSKTLLCCLWAGKMPFDCQENVGISKSCSFGTGALLQMAVLKAVSLFVKASLRSRKAGASPMHF